MTAAASCVKLKLLDMKSRVRSGGFGSALSLYLTTEICETGTFDQNGHSSLDIADRRLKRSTRDDSCCLLRCLSTDAKDVHLVLSLCLAPPSL